LSYFSPGGRKKWGRKEESTVESSLRERRRFAKGWGSQSLFNVRGENGCQGDEQGGGLEKRKKNENGGQGTLVKKRKKNQRVLSERMFGFRPWGITS